MSETVEKKIRKILKKRGWLSSKQIAEKTSIKHRTVIYNIKVGWWRIMSENEKYFTISGQTIHVIDEDKSGLYGWDNDFRTWNLSRRRNRHGYWG